MKELKNVIVKKEGSVLVVTMSREKALNALNGETIEELQHVFRHHWRDDEIGCVVLTGAGKAFVAGADIKEINRLDAISGEEFSRQGIMLTYYIQNFPKPVIAAINGFALGGGSEMALACDIRLASEKAKLGQPEVNLGIIPGYGGTQRLSRLVGKGKAMQLILTGEMLSAAEAHRIGYVDEVYPADELMEKAMELANSICAKSPIAVSLAKAAVNRGYEMPLQGGLQYEQAQFGLVCSTEDSTEGTAAFMDKRKPEFKGR